ncbi:MAG: dihydrolipoyl dehydrogenase [Deltaproteobacteria bacterium]|nr:dihydrolipoyl dehydrogenase [Deltaproteobacteria bacterium]
MKESYDLVVIGAGPGGYVAAIRGAKRGMKTALVERRDQLGGTCLLIGCIPTKELLESTRLYERMQKEAGTRGIEIKDMDANLRVDLVAMQERKDRVIQRLSKGISSLMKKNRIDVFQGMGRLKPGPRVVVESAGGGDRELAAKRVILATGSRPLELDALPFDNPAVMGSTGALSLERVPGRLAVIGAGAVGLELGLIYKRLGADVTIIEMMGQAAPFADRQIARALERSLKAQGIKLKLRTKVQGLERARGNAEAVGNARNVNILLAGPAGEERLETDLVLSAAGRVPNVAGLGLDDCGVKMNSRSRIEVNEYLETSLEGVYAVGDLVNGPMLAHKAEQDGVVAADNAWGKKEKADYALVPSAVYTSPELAQVGMTEEQAREKGLDYSTGLFSFRGNPRAVTASSDQGMVKVLVVKGSGELLGVHILGPHASELVAEAVVAMKFGANAKDLGHLVHAHPSLSEALKEACLAAMGNGIHS